MHVWVFGLVLAIVCCAWLPALPPAWVLVAWLPLAFFMTLVPGLATAPAPATYRTAVATCLAGGACGVVLACLHGYELLDRRMDPVCDLREQTIRGTVANLPRLTEFRPELTRQRFEFDVAAFADSECQGPRTLLLSFYGEKMLAPGDTLEIQAKLRQPWGLANPGSFNMQAWFAESAIDAVGTVRALTHRALPAAQVPFTQHHQVRETIAKGITQLRLDSDAEAVLRAITVADRSGLDTSLWRLLQTYGVNHLVVISGLHVGMVGGLGFAIGSFVSRLLSLRLQSRLLMILPECLAVLFGAFYTSLAGFGIASQRALFMLTCFCIASAIGRRGEGWNNLLLAAALILVLNPLAALGSGFWLSFVAVAYLLWLGTWRPNSGFVTRLLTTHTYMCIAMVPLTAYWFGKASLVAAASNLVLVPLVTVALVPVTLIAAALFLTGLPGYETLWRLAAHAIEHLLGPAQALADTQANWLAVNLYPHWLVLFTATIGALLLVIRLDKRLRLLALVCLLPLLLPDRGQRDEVPKLAILDVGQGTSVVFNSGERVLVYDTGGGDPAGANIAASVILPYLGRLGAGGINTLVASHPDNDHSAGVSTLISALPVHRYLYGAAVPGVSAGEPCIAGKSWRWPSGERFQIIAPAEETGLLSNNVSCVLMIEVRGTRILLPGDIDVERERDIVRYWGPELGSEILVAAHHGSKTSTSFAWLKHASPDTVIYTHAYGNRFGHPHPVVVERVESLGVTGRSVAQEGAILYTFPAGRAVLSEAWRGRRPRYWM